MSLLSSLLTVVIVHAEEELAPLVMPAWAFPLIAAIVFALLGVVSWSYRDVANRHSDKNSDEHQSTVH